MKNKILALIAVAFVAPSFANSASGTVLIAAPSSANGPSAKGIWFVNPANGKFSLELAELAEDEVYEGWIVNNRTGRVASSGIFRVDGKGDSDAAGPFAGALKLDIPPTPGSDFLSGPFSRVVGLPSGDYSVVITIESYPDRNPSPSNTKVLKVAIPKNVQPGTVLELEAIHY